MTKPADFKLLNSAPEPVVYNALFVSSTTADATCGVVVETT